MEWQSIIQSRHELNLDVQVQNSSIASHSSQQLPMTIHSCILFLLQQMNQLTFCSVQNKSQPSFQFSTTATTPKKYTEILFGRSIEKVNTNSTFFLYKTVNYKQHIKETICFCHPLQKRVYFQNISMLPHSATLVAGCIKYTTIYSIPVLLIPFQNPNCSKALCTTSDIWITPVYKQKLSSCTMHSQHQNPMDTKTDINDDWWDINAKNNMRAVIPISLQSSIPRNTRTDINDRHRQGRPTLCESAQKFM